MSRIEPTSSRAIVIGGSIAGLLTARVLSEYFDKLLSLIATSFRQPRRPVEVYRNRPNPTFCSPGAIAFSKRYFPVSAKTSTRQAQSPLTGAKSFIISTREAGMRPVRRVLVWCL